MTRRYRHTTSSMYPKMLEIYWQGYGYHRIARMLNVHPVTVGNYIRSVVPESERRKVGGWRGPDSGLVSWASRTKKKRS